MANVRYKDHTVLSGAISATDRFPMDEHVSGTTFQTRYATGTQLQDWALAAVTGVYAPLASPALTGVPTAPTASGGTNTTQIATTAFVTSAIAAIPSTDWGDIGGTLSDQTDLQSALDAKVPTTRTVNGHALSSDVTVTKSDVGLGNVEDTALSTWAGSTNITTLGTVATGTWNGAVIGSNYGGAGSVNGILKANGSGVVSAAVAGTDYVSATAPGSSGDLIYNNGGAYAAIAGSEYSASADYSLKFTPTADKTGLLLYDSTSSTIPTQFGGVAVLQHLHVNTGSYYHLGYSTEDDGRRIANYMLDGGLYFDTYLNPGFTSNGILPYGGFAFYTGASAAYGGIYQFADDEFAIGIVDDFSAEGGNRNRITFSATGVTSYAPASALADGDVAVNHVHFYLDEAADGLKAKWKESGGTVFDRTFANLDQAQTLTNKTLTTPTIASFTNATHDHTNATGGGQIAISNAVSGLGTGVATALAVNVGSAGAFVTFNGALGTPSSGTLTNCTGLLPTTGISGWPANSAGVLTNNGSGTLSWAAAGGGLTVGTTTVTSGTGGRLMYETTGNVLGEISTLTSDGSLLAFASGVTTGTGTTSGLNATANSLTTGDAFTFSSSSVTTGNVVKLASTSTAAGSNTQTVLNVTTSGANGTSSQTTFAAQFSNTHTGTSSTNIAIYGTASGGTTNLAGYFVGVQSNTIPMMAVGLTTSGLGRGTNGDFTFLYSGLTRATLGSSFLELNGIALGYSSAYGAGTDLFLRRNAAAHLTFGNSDAASPVAQTLSVQNVVAGTSNTAGADWTKAASRSTGNAIGGAHVWQVAPAGSSGTSQNVLVEAMRIKGTGVIQFPTTITAGGTTGDRTIDKTTGTVNIAATGTTVTVTNSLVTTSSIIYAVIRTNDTTARIANVVPGSGSFVINLTAAATAEVSIGFIVFNS